MKKQLVLAFGLLLVGGSSMYPAEVRQEKGAGTVDVDFMVKSSGVPTFAYYFSSDPQVQKELDACSFTHGSTYGYNDDCIKKVKEKYPGKVQLKFWQMP